MADIIDQLSTIVGEANVFTGEEARQWPSDWDTNQPCHAKAVVRPGSTDEVAAILKLCHEHGQSVVPFGGRTNLVQACSTTAADIALAFGRMSEIEETDPTAQTITVQAGVTMQQAQEAADAAGLFFPVDIGARGSCEAGGFVSTNAGGTKVIRYGMTRDSVLGLEAVLADGTVISSMNRYIKNNSGFDLKQMFIGAEGLLGVITKVIFRLSVKPATHNVALVACEDYSQMLQVLQRSRQLLGASLCGFEVMWDSFYSLATRPAGEHESPFDDSHALYGIIESMGSNPSSDDDVFVATLESLLEESLIVDAVVAKSQEESSSIWAIRDAVEWLVTLAQNFDVSLRSSDVAQYIADIERNIRADFPDALIAAFGHLGDNNLHVSVMAKSEEADAVERVEQHVYECLRPYQGAISAEHGIGLEKKAWLSITRSEKEIALMKLLKATLDPENILNPGKVIG
jgi:FAD/FMN-containing dehydrogenase